MHNRVNKMKNLLNIPGLEFKDNTFYLDGLLIKSLEHSSYRTYRDITIHFACPDSTIEIKKIIKAYHMVKELEFSHIQELRFQNMIGRGLNHKIQVTFILDIPSEEFSRMLDLTGCFKTNGGVNFTKGKDPADFVCEGGK